MMSETIPFKIKFFSGIAAFALAWFLFPFFFELQIFPVPAEGPSWLSLDPSWQLCMNYVNNENLNWGHDFVYTYGPLAFLSTRVGWEVNKLSFLCFDLFLAFNYFLFFYFLLAQSKSKAGALAMAVVAAFILPKHLGPDVAILLMVILIFWVRQGMVAFTWFVFSMQCILAILLFYMKMNTGLFSVVFIFMGLLSVVFGSNRKSPLMLLLILVPIILIALVSPLLHVSLIAYIKGALEMVDGYNAIMYLNEPYEDAFFMALFLISGAIILLAYQGYLQDRFTVEFFLKQGLLLLPLYILYKQGFTRGDINHIQEFYTFFPWLLLANGVFQTNYEGDIRTAFIWLAAFMSLFIMKRKDEHMSNVWERWYKSSYWQGYTQHTDTSAMHILSNPINIIPAHVLQKIGRQSVDIIPWNAQLLIENRLNYTPRPVFQTYTAYTPYLQELNYNAFLQDKSPEHIIYEFETIDGRYAGFDETKLQLLIQQHYTCADTFYLSGRLHVLLSRNKTPNNRLQLTKEYDAAITDTLPAKENVFYEVYTYNTLRGQLVSVMYHAPEIQLGMLLPDGNTAFYRTSGPLLSAGFGSNRHYYNTEQYMHHILGDSLDYSLPIQGFCLKTNKTEYFKPLIHVKEYVIQ